MQLVPSPRVGRNSLGDPSKDSSCWELVLQGEIRLVVGLSGGAGGWSLGELGVGVWAGCGAKQ